MEISNMKKPELIHTASEQFEAEVNQPLSDEELEDIAGGMQGPIPGNDFNLQRKDQPEGKLPPPLYSKGLMGN